MISGAVDATHQLGVLISGTFYPADAMKLVRLGADPNTQRADGNSLLHLTIVTNATNQEHYYDALIEELVQKYHADIHIRNNSGQTPLQYFISGVFYPADAMKLVRLGADPNTQRADGNSLLHLTIVANATNQEHYSDALIEELVQKYHADIHIKNNSGQTPLQYFISGAFAFYPADAMKLVRLGADPNTQRADGNSLLHLTIAAANAANQEHYYDTLIKELHYYSRRYERNNLQRSNFLNLLILLGNERSNTKTKEGSIFRRLPMDIIRYIISYLDLESSGRTSQEAQALAMAIFSENAKIKMMARAPGGINVFEQKDTQTHRSKFTFFKSVTTLILDYKKLEAGLKDKQKHHIPKLKSLLGTKLTPESQARLSEFKNYTIECLHLQSSLFPAEKLQLHKAIKDSKLGKGLPSPVSGKKRTV